MKSMTPHGINGLERVNTQKIRLDPYEAKIDLH
jgi:hypothetical protein